MPELPEVETVARELRQTITGRQISAVKAHWKKSFDNQSKAGLSGQNIISISRKGKYLIVALSHTFLIIHLRMTGQLIYRDEYDQHSDSHLRAQIDFSDGSKLLFRDTRKFGRIYHVDNPEHLLGEVGMDAMDSEMTADFFINVLAEHNTGIKALLLSQREISGLGNIYVDESLFRAGIHPAVKARQISEEKALGLYESIRHILSSAIENMGSTISDYRDIYGSSGTNQNFFKVYQRTGKACTECGAPIKRMIIGSRSTHYCPKCQLLPRKRSKTYVR